MYSLTFRVRVTTPRSVDEMERRTQQARRFYRPRGESSPACVVCVCGMRAACGGPGGLPLGSATHFHSVANPPNSAQLGGIPYHSPKLHPGLCDSVGMQPRTDRQTDTHTHTHTQTRVTTIHFSWSTTHAKCNKAFIDHTSPALCTPVTPFSPIGDAAYRQHVGGPSHGHGQHAQKFVKIARVVPEISSRTDRQTDRQTHRQTDDILTTVLRNRSLERSKYYFYYGRPME